MTDIDSLPVLQGKLQKGAFTCTEMIEAFLERIQAHASLNAFVEVFAHDARSRATVIDAKLKRGTAGKLAGLVVGIKDNMVYRHHKGSAGSKMLAEFESLFTATAVQRLLDEDAIVIGRLNCDEFAMGSANKFSHYGTTHNPVDPQRTPGGSSGGSAAAVAARLVHASLGSDTGGSIRQPASFTGTLGFKPSYGRISRHGLVAFASSFDQIGPLARSMDTLSALYEVMAGADEYDSTATQRPVTPVALSEADKDAPRRIAYFKDVLESPKLDEKVKKQTQDYLAKLRDKGHEVEGVDFPLLDYLVPTYYILSTAEASSNLARYDGIHYGYRSEEVENLETVYKRSRTEGFGPEVKRRILLGTFVLSSGYYDAYYGKAQKARRLIADQTEALFKRFDFLVSPTTPHPAFLLEAESSDPTAMYLEDIFTVHANLTGTPAISLPLLKGSGKLPVGLQLTAPRFAEKALLQFAHGLLKR
ncbi:MAG: Asp-tRNA(Asn)/Glu-tRNA(Gln) amidotransferase subunit GatA [Schleiferiaceae bacterium]|nr:Asp-tRNA(Asn)/Glu-tRNA(Gln) amidotransferase subunit GatA [Schleiferiaceae bacterium]MDR9441676.1 Asp-tRNA(Asn)/Glu-tRNA(Gln) amidotransferase subunit GatA [Schleiferiaceae bacterium]